MTKHRVHYKLFGEGKFARVTVFDVFDTHGVENCKIELVEEFPCESKEQLNKREGYYIQNNECVNKNIPGRTLADWLDATRDHRIKMARSWQAANPEKVKEADKKYKAANRERLHEKVTCDVCGGVCSRQCFERHKRSDKCMAAKRNRQPLQAIEEKAPAIL